MLRRTPCVGICSTTYGDLVCRGCKRFAHEIVQWNGFDAGQRGAVWQRLLSLRAGAVLAVLEVVDEARLRGGAESLGMADHHDLDAANVGYEVLRRLQWRERRLSMTELGLQVGECGDGDDPAQVLARIDREFYQRSLAHYERNYRIPAQ
jgi:uncharacterized protein